MAITEKDIPEAGEGRAIAPLGLELREQQDKKGRTWLIARVVPSPELQEQWASQMEGADVDGLEVARAAAGMTKEQRELFINLAKSFLLDALKEGLGLDMADPDAEAQFVEVDRSK